MVEWHTYEIKVESRLESDWVDRFGQLEMESLFEADGSASTVMWGSLDRAALRGLLIEIFDLGIKLVYVCRHTGTHCPHKQSGDEAGKEKGGV